MREVAIVVGRGHMRVGSTRLRGEQLATLCAQAMAGTGHPVRLRFHDEPIADALAIVHKSVLLPPYRDALPRLRAAGCRLLVDFLDTLIRQPLARHAHGFLACSRAQAEHLRASFPKRPVVELPHHADLDVPDAAGRWDAWRGGYFGDPRNAAHLGAVVAEGLVTAWATPVRDGNGWRAALADHNLHYAVRPRSMWGGRFKPFTKGMLAARVGAVVVVDASDDEAMHLLGADYPFAMPAGCDAATLLARLSAMRAGFGDASWALARARMAPLRAIGSADHQVALLRAALLGHGPLAGWLR